ncbi:MAG: endopeptidase La [bacterium]|nr:endopeptidase La [bacterium]
MTEGKIIIPDKFPVINITAASMVFPYVISQVFLKSPSGMEILEEAANGKCPFIFAVMGKPDIQEVPDRWYDIGMVAELEIVPEDFSVLLKGLYRARAVSWERSISSDNRTGYWIAKIEKLEDEKSQYFIGRGGKLTVHPDRKLFFKTVFYRLKKLIERFVEISGEEEAGAIGAILDNFENYDFNTKLSMDQIIWALLSVIPEASASEKQAILSETGIIERIGGIMKLLAENIFMLQLDNRIENTPQENTDTDKSQPDNTKNSGTNSLIKKDDDFIRGAHPELVKKWKRFQEIKPFMNEDARKVAMEDFARLKAIKHPDRSPSEWTKYSDRLDFNLDLPWNIETEQEKDITRVKKILDEDHYGLEHIKEVTCDNVAPMILNPSGKSPILCFVGPPGVGKTSFGKSVARALNRKFVRISLGGVRDEAYIRGHRVTYVGSEPGSVLREIQRCGSKNPVFMIDEIDKLGGMSISGDPSSAMLEVLDPEQNRNFKDHFLDAGFDLSKVFFIATANVEHTIPEALRDRMNIIRLPGYLEPEKVEIAKNFLIPRWLIESGLSKTTTEGQKDLVTVTWEDGIVSKIIQDYTDEAGVRSLERAIETILKKTSKEYLSLMAKNETLSEYRVNDKVVEDFLGPAKIFKNRARPTTRGVVIGLAWTPTGGGILYIESKLLPSFKNNQFVFSHTGSQGKVMEESSKVALSLVRERLGDESIKLLRGKSIHLHVPEGAIPKDGPSAGITFFCSLYSAITGNVVRPYLAMTGETCLSGIVMPVGGIREKVVSAHRAGIKEVILPKENERNLADIPTLIKDDIKIHLAETIDDVIKIAFMPHQI